MAGVKFLPLISLTQYTGSNKAELPLDSYTSWGNPTVTEKDGTITITWPPQMGQIPVVINTGDWLTPDGMVWTEEYVQAGYVRLSDLKALL